MQLNLTGTGVALVTPFNEDKSIDFKALEGVINHCIDGGVNYLVSLGTTGESVVLSQLEQQQVLDATKKCINGRVALIAGIGGNNTKDIIERIKSFDLSGVSAILSSSPNYNKPSQEGIYQHYKAIANSTEHQIILYNVPSRTGKNMEASTTIRLANDFKNIIAIKDASCDMGQCMEIVKHTAEDFSLISGDDLHALPMISFGCKGVISVIAQGIPEQYSKMIQLALSGDFNAASIVQFEMLDLINEIYTENNPAGIKAVLAIKGLIKNEVRLPLVPATKLSYERLEKYC